MRERIGRSGESFGGGMNDGCWDGWGSCRGPVTGEDGDTEEDWHTEEVFLCNLKLLATACKCPVLLNCMGWGSTLGLKYEKSFANVCSYCICTHVKTELHIMA